MATEALGKWQVQTDDYGNLYFYNGLTGESVWELPDEEDQVEVDTRNQVQDLDKTENPREHLSVFTIAVGVAEVVVKLVESIEENAEKANKSKVRRKFVSPAAEKRFLKNAANTEKKKKHLHDRNVRAYMDVLIPTCEPGSSTVAQEEGQQRRGVGSLFTAEESRKWQQERELEREAKRRAIRRARRQHQAKVESLQRHQQMLILFRSDLMKYLLGKILCSTELQRQRILLLTTPQMLAEMMERKREMQKAVEPEIAEKMVAEERHTKQKYEKNLQKVFEAIDEAGTGKLHLLQILFGVFSKEKPQKYAAKVRGLAGLLGSTELQRFLIEFVSQSSRGNAGGPQLITVAEFREFVTIIEEVLDHYAGVKAAVEDAEYDIEATLSTAASSTAGVSLARARMGKMVLAVTDKAVRLHTARNHLVLQTIPCRTEKMADYSFEQATIMQKSLRSPFVAEVATVDKHTFQLFSELGLLVECWPVLFVVSEYFDRGCWLDHYCKSFIEESKAGVRYAAVEQHLRSVFRQVASGLASMHSLGLLHLNVNLGNIYVATNSDDGNIHVRLGGLLSWKHDFDVDNLKASNMHDCFNYNYAPPEVVKELPITPTSDSWMLGCALCEALFMWQRQQLILSSPNQSARPTPMLIFHCKTIGELLQKLPIATSAGLRSLIRMLLQPNPAQRPQMNQVVDLLSSPSQNTIC
ncbi:hypothetical protein KRP22_004453 [Phytophthora ramorum]|nr:Serine/threonine-protein kinase Nek3 [Phytophthora ramorum]